MWHIRCVFDLAHNERLYQVISVLDGKSMTQAVQLRGMIKKLHEKEIYFTLACLEISTSPITLDLDDSMKMLDEKKQFKKVHFSPICSSEMTNA